MLGRSGVPRLALAASIFIWGISTMRRQPRVPMMLRRGCIGGRIPGRISFWRAARVGLNRRHHGDSILRLEKSAVFTYKEDVLSSKNPHNLNIWEWLRFK